MLFITKKARFPSPGPPKSIQNRTQTDENAKVEAKSSRKAIWEAVESNFGPQDSDLGAPEADFGDQNGGGEFFMRTFRRDQRHAQGL